MEIINVDNNLLNYIEKNIFPEYSKNEKGHGIEHILYVIDRSMKLGMEYNLDLNIVYTIAAYHDIGHHIDPKNHEKLSAQIFYNDDFLKKYFNEEQRKIIKEAIEDHRSSLKSEPRTIYGVIITSADKSISVKDIIKRTISYSIEHYSHYTYEQQLERAISHLIEKFGESGYAKKYIKDEKYEKFLEELRSLLKDKEKFKDIYDNIYKEVIRGE